MSESIDKFKDNLRLILASAGAILVLLMLIFIVMFLFSDNKKTLQYVGQVDKSLVSVEQLDDTSLEISVDDLTSFFVNVEHELGSDYEEFVEFRECVGVLIENAFGYSCELYETEVGVVGVLCDYKIFEDTGQLSVNVHKLKEDLAMLTSVYNWGVVIRLSDGEENVIDVESLLGEAYLILYTPTSSFISHPDDYVLQITSVTTFTAEELRNNYDEDLGLWALLLDEIQSYGKLHRVEAYYPGYGYMYYSITPFEKRVLESLRDSIDADTEILAVQQYIMHRGVMIDDFYGTQMLRLFY